MPTRRSPSGSTRVKVSRQQLIERLEVILSHEEKTYEQELSVYEEALDDWMRKVKVDLHVAVDRFESEGELPEMSTYRGEMYLKIPVPDRPEPPKRPRDTAGVLRMLRMNPDDTITVSGESYLLQYLEDQPWE